MVQMRLLYTMNKHRQAFYFFSIGLWNSFSPTIVCLVATQDVLAGTLIPTTILAILSRIPEGLSKVISPFIVTRIHPGWSMLLGSFLLTTANILIVVYDLVEVRLAGVVVFGFAHGLLWIALLQILSCYDDIDVFTSASESGANVSSLLASLIYTVPTIWYCAAPRTVIAVCIPTGLLPYVFYCLLDKEPLKKHASQHSKMNRGRYKKVSADGAIHESDGSDDEDETGIKVTKNRFCSKIATKLTFFLKVFPYITYYMLCNFMNTVSLQSVLSTVTFPSAPFRVRDHFLFYVGLFDLGWCLGGFELVIVSFLFPKKVELFKMRRLWRISLIEVGVLIVFISLSWYRFVHTVYVVLALCFIQGLLLGATSVHSIVCAADTFTDVNDKGIAMGMVAVGNSIGRFTGGLLGLFVEGYLRSHCTNRLLLGKFCLSRFENSAGWSSNINVCNSE